LFMANKKPTLTFQDIAKAAGVSPATVSRLVSRSARVSPAVEKRVRDAAEKLGVPLEKRGGARLIAFLLGNRSLLHPFHSQVLLAAEEYCAKNGYNLLLFPFHYGSDASWRDLYVPRLLERGDLVDGFIVAGINFENLLLHLQHAGLPFSVYGDLVQGRWSPESYDVVWVDDISGAYDLTRYLHSLGHTQIWYIANSDLTWFARRQQGYLRAVQELGLEPLTASLDTADEQEIGFLLTKQILRRGSPVQAIFGGSDAICHGIYTALREADLAVPNDISVAGFNDTIEASILHPTLTTVRGFPDLLGRLLAEVLLHRILHPQDGSQSREIPTRVIRRESTCAAAGRPISEVQPALGANLAEPSGGSV
jgi:LacI family transcriptional regulator